MKNKILYSLVFIALIIVFAFIYLVFTGKKVEETKIEKTKTKIDILNDLANKLEKKYKDNYPLPKGNIVLLDNDLKQIHLENKDVSLDKVDNLYVIQWNTCFLKNDAIFSNIYFDKEFSIKENKKCFAYSVTKDRKKFQIWAVVYKNWKYVAYIVWNTKWSIIKDIYSNNLVKNWSSEYLPYIPAYNNKVFVKWLKWSGELIVSYLGIEKKYNLKDIKDGIYLPEKVVDEVKDLWLKLKWNNGLVKVVFADGNIVYLNNKNSNNDASIYIKDFTYNWEKTKLSVVNKLWKIVYNMVKISNDSNIELSDNIWNVLTIRWTKFSLDLLEKDVAYYLEEGSLEIFNEDNVKYLLDKTNKLLWLAEDKINKIYDLWENKWRVSDLLSYSVLVNDYLEPNPNIVKYNDSILMQNTLSWIKKYFTNTNDIKLDNIVDNVSNVSADLYEVNNLPVAFVKISWNVLSLSSLAPKFASYLKTCSKEWNCKPFYLREELNNFCKQAWYNRAYRKWELYELFDSLNITNTWFEFILDQRFWIQLVSTPVLFNDNLGNTADNLSVLFYNPYTKTFSYSYPYDSKNKFDWFYVVCKK